MNYPGKDDLRAVEVSGARPMVLTLVFTLVILGILVERFDLSGTLAAALVFYTVVNTTLPGFVLRGEPVDFEDVEALPALSGR